MPSLRTSDSDAGASALQHELALLLKGRTRRDFTGDDLLQAFQDVDYRNKGSISSKSDVIGVLCDAVTTKYQRRIDFDLVFKSFRTHRSRFDYTAFCEAFESHRQSHELAVQRPVSPNKLKRPEGRSPLKSPHARSNWLIQQQQQQLNTVETPRELGGVTPAIRVDPRLETQRLLSQSIRRKLVGGVIGAQYDGFKGIEELLFELDEAGDGCIADDVFDAQLLRRLKKPLTKQEAHFLLANLRVQTTARPVIHYEHLASLCNLDSDASGDDADDDGPAAGKSIAATPNDPPLSLGGADFLAVEKRLRSFFRQPVASESDVGKHSISETPRSIPTGAEQFLEQAEAVDTKRTGFLTEQDFCRIFEALRLDISDGLVRAMLERFPRSSDHKVEYRAFLARYGENPELARERRKLKRMLTTVLAAADPRHVDDWFQYLSHRCERYDARLHKRTRGDIPEKEFVHVLRGSSSPVRLSVDDATAIATQFLRVSRSSRADAVVYREFLGLVRDCRAQANAASSSSSSPNASATTATDSPSPASPPLHTADANIADYLIHDATADERERFELLMDTLHKFQQRITTTKEPTRTGAPRSANQSREGADPGERGVPVVPSATSRVGAITPIDNGVLVVLGSKLQVRIQFALSDEHIE